MKFIILFCDTFFWYDPSYYFMGWNWVLQKNNCLSSGKLFFRTYLDDFQSTPNLYGGRLGVPETLFSLLAWRKRRHYRKIIFQAPKNCFFELRKIVFSRILGLLTINSKINMRVDLGTWNIIFPNNLMKIIILQKINFSRTDSFKTHIWIIFNRTWNIIYLIPRRNVSRRESSPQPQYLRPTHCQLSYAVFDHFPNIRKKQH